MVILIGGAGYTGKTIMAQKLLEIYKIPYFSIDHLKMGIFRSNKRYYTEGLELKFASPAPVASNREPSVRRFDAAFRGKCEPSNLARSCPRDRDLAPFVNKNCGFKPDSPDKIITDKLWPIIKEIIKTNIENDQNIIIEGCYFPESIEDIEKEYLDKIIMFSMGFSEQYIRKNLYSEILEKRNILEKRIHEFIENTEEYIMENKNRKEICVKNKLKHFEINENYETEIKNIFKWIENEIEKRKIFHLP